MNASNSCFIHCQHLFVFFVCTILQCDLKLVAENLPENQSQTDIYGLAYEIILDSIAEI